jgi:hypothetical protein
MKRIATIYELDNGYIVVDERHDCDCERSSFYLDSAEAVANDIEGMLMYYEAEDAADTDDPADIQH